MPGIRIGAVGLLAVLTLVAEWNPVLGQQGGAGSERNGSVSGGFLRIVGAPALEGTDTMSARFNIDTGVTLTPGKIPCGPRRACQPGWDLRLISISAPVALPVTLRIPTTIRIDNGGRVRSPASELQLCGTQLILGRACTKSIELIPIPSLEPGETMELRRLVSFDHAGQPFRLIGRIDPDKATGEKRAENNDGETGMIRPARAGLEWITFEAAQPYKAGQPLLFTLRLRNMSFIAPSEPTQFALTYSAFLCSVNDGTVARPHWDTKYEIVAGDYSKGGSRVDIPSIGPRQVLRLTLSAQDVLQCRSLKNIVASARVDPERRVEWADGHQPYGKAAVP